jgi:LmbE family N-acetylglucosaminyl deacetylase
MLTLNLPTDGKTPLKVLCLGSHADDIEIGCGGTMLQLLASHPAVHVVWVVFSANPERANEARISGGRFLEHAKQKEIIVKDFRDGFFPFEGTKIKESFEELKNVSPDLILTHNRKDAHQDHRLIAELTWNTFRDHLILEYEIPKYDGDFGQPNFFVPMNFDTCQTKVRYIMDSFQSQHGKRWFQPETFLSLMRLRGMECNAPTGYAEAFYSRKIVMGPKQ